LPCVCLVRGRRCRDGQDLKLKAFVALRQGPPQFAFSQILKERERAGAESRLSNDIGLLVGLSETKLERGGRKTPARLILGVAP
jgi:hypothetical protein